MWAINAFKSLVVRTTVNDVRLTQVANKFGYGPNRPRQRFPIWFLKKERKVYDEQISKENQKFLQQTVEEKFGKPIMKRGVLTHEKASTSLIKSEKLPTVQWTPKSIRTGVMGRKIGTYPIWLKNGTRIITTAIQILDNHVIKYTPPEHNNPSNKKHLKDYSKSGMILMGSETVDPNTLTSNYMGLFQQSGVMPKKNLTRFNVSHDAALPPGTELNVLHYKPGEVVDVRGLTIDRGFCGVMKRWGFKGQPATHGATKTHRRPGSIGGGLRARVWPGKKMPGHMGNRWRIAKGLKIYRINRKYNTMWVSGHAVPGDVNGLVYIYDTVLPLRKVKEPHFPTFNGDESKVPEDWYDEEVHQFGEPTIFFEPEK